MKKGLLFGPVNSRRLGRSLGLEMVPRKVCSFDCIYCEVGKTTTLTCDRREYTPFEEIRDSIEIAKLVETDIDVLTFTGSGEPTLNSKFLDAVMLAKKSLQKPIAVLTNSSLLSEEDILKACSILDIVLPSLDSAIEESFRLINQPAGCVDLKNIISSLFELRSRMKGEMWLEVLLVKGINDSERDINELKRILKDLNPHKVQLNTVVRPGATAKAKPLTYEELEKIAQFLGDNAEVIVSKSLLQKIHNRMIRREELIKIILDYISRRPATLEELSTALGVEQKEVYFLLEELVSQGSAEKKTHQDKEYYLA